MQKKLAFVIKLYQDFIRIGDKQSLELDNIRLNSFFDAISDSYIPIIQLLERLESNNIKCCLGLVIPPVLCSMLENPDMQELYILSLDKRIALGKKELSRCKQGSDSPSYALIKGIVEKYTELKKVFTTKYDKNLIKQFAEFQRKGIIEILATCATDIFMPHFADLPEALSAQIEIGLQAYKKSFGEIPDGFFLPEFGYIPGIEKIIRAYGYSYTILHSRSVLLIDNPPKDGTFYPVRTENALVIFSADLSFQKLIYGEEAYGTDSTYRNENRDIGFELDLKKLSPVLEQNSARYCTGYKYWKKDYSEEQAFSYVPEDAAKKAEEDAQTFVENRNNYLEKAACGASNEDYVVSICCIDDNKIRRGWYEYLLWLEKVIEKTCQTDIELSLCKDLIKKPFSLEKIAPCYSAGTGEGYGENLLSSRNCWMMRYVRKATERMIDLAERFPSDTGLKTRLLNIGSVELLIAQSSMLAKMVDEADYLEYAERRFRLSINAFTTVFDSLGSNTVSTEWLTTLESLDTLFPWINYKVFSKKK